MTADQWHVDEGQMARYAAGAVEGTAACSVEAHLMSCVECRDRLAPRVDRGRLDAVWAEVVDLTDQPVPGLVERLLRGVGVSIADARLLSSTSSMRLSWFAAVAVLIAFAATVGQTLSNGDLLFLLVAPVLPVLGVAVAYGESFDPVHSVARAAPMPGLRLLLLRSVAVLVPTIGIMGPAGLLVGPPRLSSAAWLAPSLALVVTCLALTTFVTVGRAAVAVSSVWMVAAALAQDRYRTGVEGFGASTQLAAVVLAAAAAAVLAARADHLDLGPGDR
jgi:hypothetical protein